LLALAGVSLAQEDPTQKETLRLQALTDKERSSLQAENARHEEWKRQNTARTGQMRQEIQRLRKEADSLKLIAANTHVPVRTISTPVSPTATAEVRRKAFSQDLAAFVETLLPRFKNEPASEMRIRAFQELAQGLRSGSLSPEEGVGQLFDQLSEIVDEGGRLRAEPGSYTAQNGSAVRGTWIHAGGMLEGFANADGSFAALRLRGQSQWTELSESAERQALARSARILLGQERGLVELPLKAAP
jgi:hypothetical protein